MLKRLSATFSNGNDGPTQYAPPGHHPTRGPAPNLSHSTSYNGQTTDVPEGSYAHPAFANGAAASSSSSLSPIMGYGLPRPPSQSTPYSEQGGGTYPGPSSYFPDTSSQYGSMNRSPMPSPRLPSNSQLPNYTTGKQATNLPGPHQTQPIDRVALQKSLKSVETVLVALDEYRELNVRLAKVEKRLGKSMKELAGSIAPAGAGDKHVEAASMAPQSIISALITGSNLFELLADTNTKFSKSCQREYDGINELCGKQFKRIAKDEGKHDEVLESLDAKLKKANFQYDKQRVKSSSGSGNMYGASGVASAAHEQFVPVLSQLTEGITKAKLAHGLSMAGKRDTMVREVARAMGNLSELEFRRACDNVRKAGAEIGPVMGAQALLGEKPDKGEASPMPRAWPTSLQVDENERLQAPPYLGSPSFSNRDVMPNGQFPHGLQPPRSSGERFDSVASRGSSRRSSVTFAPKIETISRQSSPRLPPQQLSSPEKMSPPHAASSSPRQHQKVLLDAEATVVQRHPAPSRPALETSCSSYSRPSQGSPQEESPSYRETIAARMPSVQTPSVLQHAVSQRGNVGYIDSKRVDRAEQEQGGFADTSYETMRKMSPGFELDETEMSPDKPLRNMQDAQSAAQSAHAAKLDYGDRTEDAKESERVMSTDLHRSISIESTASQQSFVARMKAKYAEEKEARQVQPVSAPPSGSQARRPLPVAGPTHSAASSSSSGSSGARVSSIAQRYEQNSSMSSGFISPPSSRNTSYTHGSLSNNLETARPQHKQRASLPVVPAAQNSFKSNVEGTDLPRQEAHPSFCGCEECARSGYNTRKADQSTGAASLGGRANAGHTWEGDNGTMRSNRSNRRVSMPVGYGSR